MQIKNVHEHTFSNAEQPQSEHRPLSRRIHGGWRRGIRPSVCVAVGISREDILTPVQQVHTHQKQRHCGTILRAPVPVVSWARGNGETWGRASTDCKSLGTTPHKPAWWHEDTCRALVTHVPTCVRCARDVPNIHRAHLPHASVSTIAKDEMVEGWKGPDYRVVNCIPRIVPAPRCNASSTVLLVNKLPTSFPKLILRPRPYVDPCEVETSTVDIRGASVVHASCSSRYSAKRAARALRQQPHILI